MTLRDQGETFHYSLSPRDLIAGSTGDCKGCMDSAVKPRNDKGRLFANRNGFYWITTRNNKESRNV